MTPRIAPQRYGRGTQRSKRDGSMTGLEKRYSLHLELRKRAGEIQAWWFEPERFRLADGTFYTPDFRVMMQDGQMQFHETKGVWTVDRAASIRIKVAAEIHPYRFFKVAEVKKPFTGWEVTEV